MSQHSAHGSMEGRSSPRLEAESLDPSLASITEGLKPHLGNVRAVLTQSAGFSRGS